MNLPGSVEAVLAAIREDAREEIARIERDASAAASRLRQEDASAPVAVPRGDARLGEARRRARERIAQEDWADRQSAMTAREAWIAQVVSAAMGKTLAQPAPERRDILIRFAREALDRLAGTDCELLVSASDLPLLDEAARHDMEVGAGKRVTVNASPEVESGCLARTLDGRMQFDNTLAARARRFEPYWRHALGELFAGAMVVHA